MFFFAQIHPFIFLGKRMTHCKLTFGYNFSAKPKPWGVQLWWGGWDSNPISIGARASICTLWSSVKPSISASALDLSRVNWFGCILLGFLCESLICFPHLRKSYSHLNKTSLYSAIINIICGVPCTFSHLELCFWTANFQTDQELPVPNLPTLQSEAQEILRSLAILQAIQD